MPVCGSWPTTHSSTPGGTLLRQQRQFSPSGCRLETWSRTKSLLFYVNKLKFDEIKALFEADLIRSFERTRHHGIRWKGFSPEGALDGVDLSLPSEEHTRALCQEVNYMVAHSLHRHSESLVNAFERVALRVI
jgi:hypothetical protein